MTYDFALHQRTLGGLLTYMQFPVDEKYPNYGMSFKWRDLMGFQDFWKHIRHSPFELVRQLVWHDVLAQQAKHSSACRQSEQHFDKLTTGNVWIWDEIGITTVERSDRVVDRRGLRQIAGVTSAERGSFITMALAVSAIWNSLPPFLIFLRVDFKPHFIRKGPIGWDGW